MWVCLEVYVLSVNYIYIIGITLVRSYMLSKIWSKMRITERIMLNRSTILLTTSWLCNQHQRELHAPLVYCQYQKRKIERIKDLLLISLFKSFKKTIKLTYMPAFPNYHRSSFKFDIQHSKCLRSSKPVEFWQIGQR